MMEFDRSEKTKSYLTAASLIILTRDSDNKDTTGTTGTDYSVLVQKRSSKSPFFPDSVVFPGGKLHETDSSQQWLTHFRSFGFGPDDFETFQCSRAHSLHRLTLDGTDPVRRFRTFVGLKFFMSLRSFSRRHVSLRIAAIRETLEESAVLLCKSRDSVRVSDVDTCHWQDRVNKDPANFLRLCRERDCYPDLWSLHLWSNWFTPAKIMRVQFNTVFFVVALDGKPVVRAEGREVAELRWSKIEDVLSAAREKRITLDPPQWYELTRMGGVKRLETLMAFASARGRYGCALTHPVLQPASDGVVGLLPGDERYPSEPDVVHGHDIFDGSKSLEELRSEVDVAHRVEVRDGIYTCFTKNFVPHHYHLSISDGTVPTLPKSSL